MSAALGKCIYIYIQHLRSEGAKASTRKRLGYIALPKKLQPVMCSRAGALTIHTAFTKIELKC